MRTVSLAKQTDGINRMRTKGGASESGLFDLVNGRPSPKGTIIARGGTVVRANFPAGSIGCIGFDDKYHTFSHVPLTATDPNVVVDILRHPTGGVAALLEILAVFPFLGRLYVVAQFADLVVQHYWLDRTDLWTASTVLGYNDIRLPTVADGFYYQITNVSAVNSWTASKATTVGDFVQPTTANNFKYEATATSGTGAVLTSSIEPTWPLVDGATVTERRYASEPGSDPGTSTPPTPLDPGGTPGDYGPYPPNIGTILRRISEQ